MARFVGTGIILGSIGISVLAGWMLIPTSRDEDLDLEARGKAVQREVDQRGLIWEMAKDFVVDGLRSPGSADFGSVFKGTAQDLSQCVKPLDGGGYAISGWVDAQNGFGAIIRHDFVVKVRPVGGDKWQLIEPVQLHAR